MLNFDGQAFKPGKNFNVHSSYLFFYADEIYLEESSDISASALGCPTEIPKLDSTLNKY
jgi:hypothetical protein